MWKGNLLKVLVAYLYLDLVYSLSEDQMADDPDAGFKPELSNLDTHRSSLCPPVKPMNDFNIFKVLGSWYVLQYYSSSEEALTYHCMRVEFGLSRGNMDMRMRLTYRYADDPNDEVQSGNMTWQIPNPMLPGHWRHSEDHYKGVYNTDVVDTDYDNWLLLFHCSDPESDKKFLSTFILSRNDTLDALTIDYLREKVGNFDVDLDYLFPVNQTNCIESPNLSERPNTSTTSQQPHPFAIKTKKTKRSRQSRG